MRKLLTYKLFEAKLQFNDDDNNIDNTESTEKPETPFLDEFGKDLTKMAEEGRLDPVVGRKKEILETSWILSRRKKNNPVLIGEAGTGKTAIVEGLAQLIVNKKSPRSLFNKKIISVDMSTLLAGASYKGQFEQRMKVMLKELELRKDIILFIDEIHLIIAGSESMSAGNIMKPALARGDIQCIGATTLDEYRNSIEKDRALERRFQSVMVEETSPDETFEILKNIKSKYEDFHLVTYTDDALRSCIKYAGKYFTDRFFPDKAIDLMDEAGAKMHLNDSDVPDSIINLEDQIDELRNLKSNLITQGEYEQAADIRLKEKELIDQLSEEKLKYEQESNVNRIEITPEVIAEIISIKKGIPVSKLTEKESERIISMPQELKMSIIGQDQAVNKISKCIMRNRAGLKDPKKPVGVFLFLGPSGVGKTETVKQLAKFMFGSEDAIVRIDMSEYQQEHLVAKLYGAPPGYIGYGEGGQLTEKVRRKPHCIVLLDEFEKAHKNVQEVFLQVFDDGIMTDGQGRKISFKDTIIIMTSNIGAKAIQNKKTLAPVGFKKPGNDEPSINIKSILKKELNKYFLPEFLNRIDDVIIFESLSKENIFRIIDILLNDLKKRLKEMGYDLVISDTFKNLLMEKGWDEQMGARPMKRAIQKYIENPISIEILKKNIKDEISMDYNENTKEITINGNPADIDDDLNENVITNYKKFNKTTKRRKRKMIKLNG